MQFVPTVLLTIVTRPSTAEVDELRNKIIDFLLTADKLIAPANLLPVVESTFVWHYRAFCASAAQQDPRLFGVSSERRPSIMV